MSFPELLLVVFMWTVLAAGLLVPIGFALTELNGWWFIPAIGITVLILAFDLWIGYTTGFFPNQQEDNASHCGTGTTYREYKRTALVPIATGKSTVLVPRTITEWTCEATR